MVVPNPNQELSPELAKKYQNLRQFFRESGKTAVAFSGGVDSALLLYIGSREIGSDCAGIIGVSPSLPEFELKEAREFAAAFDLQIVELKTDEMEDENYTSNPTNRCYFCKSELFDKIREYAAGAGYSTIVDGTNVSELGGHRPGFAAGEERRVATPLAKLAFSKEDIRNLSEHLGLPTWNKPSFACLSSRFPTGTAITDKRLQMVGAAEMFLYQNGFKEFRVRFHDKIARIELAKTGMQKLLENDKLRQSVVDHIKSLGFLFVTLDLLEFKSGSLSTALNNK